MKNLFMKKLARIIMMSIFLVGVWFLYIIKHPDLVISKHILPIIGLDIAQNTANKNTQQLAIDPNCRSYFDGCNTCVVSWGIIESCTQNHCETRNEPRCLTYANWDDISTWTESNWWTQNIWTIGIANPASKKCIQDGWHINIVTWADGGHIGICTFPDGRTCEERAYLRGECVFDDPTTMCTMEYAPVCARVAIQCVKAPCEPIEQTFSNRCMMNANKLATYLHDGECKSK